MSSEALLLAAALSDSRRLYRSGGRSRLCSKMARAFRGGGKTALCTDNFPWNVKSAQVFIFNMRQLDIEVGPHCFLPGIARGSAHTGGAVGHRRGQHPRRLSRPGRGIRPAPPRHATRRGSSQPRLAGSDRARPGPISRRISCATTRPSRHAGPEAVVLRLEEFRLLGQQLGFAAVCVK